MFYMWNISPGSQVFSVYMGNTRYLGQWDTIYPLSLCLFYCLRAAHSGHSAPQLSPQSRHWIKPWAKVAKRSLHKAFSLELLISPLQQLQALDPIEALRGLNSTKDKDIFDEENVQQPNHNQTPIRTHRLQRAHRRFQDSPTELQWTQRENRRDPPPQGGEECLNCSTSRDQITQEQHSIHALFLGDINTHSEICDTKGTTDTKGDKLQKKSSSLTGS